MNSTARRRLRALAALRHAVDTRLDASRLELPCIASRTRRACPWHLTDLVEDEGGELVCARHRPNVWLVVDDRERIVAAGHDKAEPVLLDRPLPMATYLRTIWPTLRAPLTTFGPGARAARIPAAVRHELLEIKSRDSLDSPSRVSAPCPA